MASVYLLHFDAPLTGGRQPSHYLGWTGKERLRDRLQRHARGDGAKIIANGFKANGIGFRLVRTWPGATKAVERALKRHHSPKRMCRVCAPGSRAMVVTDNEGRVVHQRTIQRYPKTRFVWPPD